MEISVITPAFHRPRLLETVCRQFRDQDVPVPVEHIVVSDGPDDEVAAVAQAYRATFLISPRQPGDIRGSGRARDRGMEAARGRWLVFWDDDNQYPAWALATLWRAAREQDIGVCPILVSPEGSYDTAERWFLLPWRWAGEFRQGEIDTACVCVAADVARRCSWGNGHACEDFHWLVALGAQRIRFCPETWVARHIPHQSQSAGDRPALPGRVEERGPGCPDTELP